MLRFNKWEFSVEPVNHASWLDAWDRGLVVPASAATQFQGRSLNRPLLFFWKSSKEILLSDDTKQLPIVPTRPLPILMLTKNKPIYKVEPSLSCKTSDDFMKEKPDVGIWMESRSVKRVSVQSLYLKMTTASSCCEGVARNQTAPRPIFYQLLRR